VSVSGPLTRYWSITFSGASTGNTAYAVCANNS